MKKRHTISMVIEDMLTLAAIVTVVLLWTGGLDHLF